MVHLNDVLVIVEVPVGNVQVGLVKQLGVCQHLLLRLVVMLLVRVV